MDNEETQDEKRTESESLISDIKKQIGALNVKLETILIDAPEKSEDRVSSGSALIRDLGSIKDRLESILNRISL